MLAHMSKILSSLCRMTRLSAIVPLAAIVLNASAASAQLLGSAQNFAVLGASTVTNAGATDIKGDVGVSPGTAITGFLLTNTIAGPGTVTAGLGLVNGTIRPGGMVAAQAQADAHLAYAALSAMACPPINNLSGQVLGTAVLSLPTGVYCFDSSAQLTGTLSLTGAGPWVFKIGSTLTTAPGTPTVPGAKVVVVNPGANCSGKNVFWQVGSSATVDTFTQFVGNILAVASITLNNGATVDGSAIALTAAVTMDTNNVSVCEAPPVITLSATTVVAGGTVTATMANGPGNAGDWVGLYGASAADGTYEDWKYLNGTRSKPGSGVTGAAVTFTMPATPGTYNVRFFLNDTTSLLATSLTITVQ